MATIALGLATSHSPMLSTSPELWAARLEGDRAMYGDRWDELVESRRGVSPEDDLAPRRWARQHQSVQAAIDELAAALTSAEVDVVVVVGDDQQEVFAPGTLAPFAIWCADTAVDDPPDASTLPDFRVASLWGFHDEHPTTYECHPALARHLVERCAADGFDVTAVYEPPPGRHLGHAFLFVQRRLVRGARVPMVPVLVNSFYPRNQPSVRRCHALGARLAAAIEAWPTSERVALVASGGLSHHLVDEALDGEVLAALRSSTADDVLGLADSRFVDGDAPCGTGESKNWIVVGSGVRSAGLAMDLVAYEPLTRTPAGTGVGAAFARWSGGQEDAR